MKDEGKNFCPFPLLEGWANAWGHGPLPSDYPGYASASGNFTTELISVIGLH
jgi:hypothetical protein